MKPLLILARHGNTFRPEDRPVWVGARTDLPLVEKGVVQAHEAGHALQAAHITPNFIACGPLRRTRQMAEIIAATLAFPAASIVTDPRLTEIDYGAWEGKSSAEIEAAGGGAELSAWNKSNLFPASPGWSPGEHELIANTQAILAETRPGTSLLVTSNGILRFFARAATNAAAFPDRKVATGHLCVMRHEADGWRILQWNLPPEKLPDSIPS